MNALKAGLAYFVCVFAAGFLLGTIRVLLIEPKLGPLGAVLLEAPFILTASWFLCRYWVKRFSIPPRMTARLAMGAVAFALLMGAETALGFYGFGRTLTEQFAGYQTAPGVIGLAGQMLYGLFPALQARLSKAD